MSEPTTREMVTAIQRLLDWAEGNSDMPPLFSRRKAARAAIARLEALADDEDARPEQPEAMSSPTTLSVYGSHPVVIPEWARSVQVKSVTQGYDTTTTIEIRGGEATQ